MMQSSRNSVYSLCCAVSATILVLAAGRSFQNGEVTVQPYVTAPFRVLSQLNPFKQAPPKVPTFAARSIFELTENESMQVLLYYAAAAVIAAAVFAWRAQRCGEASKRWAFPAVLCGLVAFQLVQLLFWISPRLG